MTRLAAAVLLAASACATPAVPAGHLAPAEAQRLRKELARSLVAYGEWVAASRPLLELAAESPKDPEIHALLGDVYREQGLYSQAEREYDLALALAPDDPHAAGGLAVLRELRHDEGDAALDGLRRAALLEPHNPAHPNNLGFALYARGRYGEAARAFGEALRLDPASSLVRNNLGFAYGRLGDLAAARREFERASGPAAAENNLGLLQELAGDVSAACRSYREAIARDANLKVAFVNAERACARHAQAQRSAP